MKSMTIGVDLSKCVFELAVADGDWRIVERHRLSRTQFELFFANRATCTVVMEACGTAHYWGRVLQRQGFTVRLLPAQYVGAYRRRHKNDAVDAAALIEASRCAEILDVPIKSAEQQAIQGLHRLRAQWVSARTARINSLRGLLREQGINLPVGARAGLSKVGEALDDSRLPPLLKPGLLALLDEIRALEDKASEIEKQLAHVARHSPAAQQLMQVPGIGLLTATAMVAAIGSPHHFRNGRHLAAWVGLTPKQHSSGLKMKMGRISKRGDKYLRMLLIHGARSTLIRARQQAAQGKPLSPQQAWALDLTQRMHPNKAVCAIANKMVRSAWAIWKHDRVYDSHHAVAA